MLSFACHPDSHHMAKFYISSLDESNQIDQLKTIVDERGRVRLTELEDELSLPPDDLRAALVELVEDGDAALFPIGDTVQVRSEL